MNDLHKELLQLHLAHDVGRELQAIKRFADAESQPPGVGLVFAFWRSQFPELLAALDSEQLDDIWWKDIAEQQWLLQSPPCPGNIDWFQHMPLIPCEGIDALLPKYPVICRSHMRPEYGESPFACRDGIEIGWPGWSGLIEIAFCWLENEATARKLAGFPDEALPAITQVKEKFGELRIHARVPKPLQATWRTLLNDISARSSETCMKCGAPGTLRTGGWHRTLCNGCEAERHQR